MPRDVNQTRFCAVKCPLADLMDNSGLFIEYFYLPGKAGALLPCIFSQPKFLQTMKLRISVISLLLLSCLALQAQPGGGGRMMNPEQRAEQQTAQMTEQLALSEAQTGKVRDINLKYANKMKEARDKSDGDWSAMRETMTAIRGEQDQELQTVLTQEQWTQWVAFREAQRANRPGGGMGPGGNGPNTPDATPPQDGSGKSKKAKKGKKNSESSEQ